MISTAEAIPTGVREVLADAWFFRWNVELEAAERFKRLAGQLGARGAPDAIVGLANRAAADEIRHAAHCVQLAQTYGASCMPPGRIEIAEIVPSGLSQRQKLLYELVAACCVTETESTAVLTSLLAAGAVEPLKPVLRELAGDEVFHSRLGWAYLAWERGQSEVGFLSRWIPAMLDGAAGPHLFHASSPSQNAPELLRHGVLPGIQKREVFVQTCREVLFPGLAQFGVDIRPAENWLEDKLRG